MDKRKDPILFNHNPEEHKPIGKVVSSLMIEGELIFVIKIDGEELERQVRTFDPVQLQKEKSEKRREERVRPLSREELYFILEYLGFEITKDFIKLVEDRYLNGGE